MEGGRPLKLSIPKVIPRQICELRSELDFELGVTCADREGVVLTGEEEREESAA